MQIPPGIAKKHLFLQLPRSCRVWLHTNKKDRTVPLELLYALQKARIKRHFDKLAKDLQKKARWCHHYFLKREELPVESWAHYAFLEEGLSTYGHKTSNIVESMNGVWKLSSHASLLALGLHCGVVSREVRGAPQ